MKLPQNSEQESHDFVDLQQYWLILKRRWLPAAIVAGSTLGIGIVVTLLQKPVYMAEGKLMLNKSDRASALANLAGEAKELSALTQQSNPIETQAEILRSVPIVEKTIEQLKLTDEQGDRLTVKEFLEHLRVRPVKGTDVLSLNYRSTDAQEATRIINQLMKSYLENHVVTNRAEATAAREFIVKELPTVEARVVKAEVALRQFREKNRVVSLQEEAKSAVGAIAALENQITAAQSDLVDSQTRSSALQSKLGLSSDTAIALASLSQSQSVQKVLSQYREVQDQVATERARFADNHPAIAFLKRKEATLAQQLQTRIQQTINRQVRSDQDLQMGELKAELTEELVRTEVSQQALAQRVALLSNTYNLHRQRAQALPQLEQTQRQLERQVQIAQSTYEQLLKRLQEVQVVENQTVGNARIVATATTPDEPVSPRILLNLAIAGVLGILLGLLTAFGLEAKDRSVKTVEEAKKLLGYPLLGSIPAYPANQSLLQSELPVRDNPHSPASAAYEMLQANLGFTTPDIVLKSIVVTSAIPHEGKSSVSANLAVAMAQIGRRVLVIDADLRRPRQHSIWDIPNLMGLSDVLVGQATLTQATQEVMVNLEVLPCGTIPPNASALLDSQSLRTVIQQLHQIYDFIVIDTPPTTLFPDAMLLSKLTDGMVLVVRPGMIDAAIAANAKSLLEQSAQRVLGMVVNGTLSTHESKAYQGSYSYYESKEESAKLESRS